MLHNAKRIDNLGRRRQHLALPKLAAERDRMTLEVSVPSAAP